MAIPQGWAFGYAFTNTGSGIRFSNVSEARGICPHCGLATTLQVRSAEHDTTAGNRETFYLILACNFASCRKTIYVQTSVVIAHGTVRNNPQDSFFVHPSRAIEPPHPSIPVDIADDWLETQRSFAGGNPKATAMMLRRVLYGVLLDKGCKLQPLQAGMQELISKQRLPAVFDDWLPAIKDDGHDAAHPDRALKVSTENVAETMEYTAELLRYLYIEPYEFQQRKARNAAPAVAVASRP
jgi:hypothetical protein